VLIGGTLARYISLRFIRTIALVFATVFALVYTLDFVELMRRAGDAEGATPGLLARLSLYRTPAVAEQVFPFAVLFGSMATLLQLSRKLELVVARAAGISAWQFLQPGLGVAILLGAVTVALYNPLSARLKLEATTVESTLFGRKMKGVGPDIWIQQRSVDGSAIIRAAGAVEATSTISGVTVFAFDKAGAFRERIEAPEGRLRDGFWEFVNAQVLALGDEPRTYASYLLSTNLAPSQLRQTFTPPESVPFWRCRTRSPGRRAAASTPLDTGCNTTCCWRAPLLSSRWCFWRRLCPCGSFVLAASRRWSSAALRRASCST
jgi:lipopolysaccharide export system permease protein